MNGMWSIRSAELDTRPNGPPATFIVTDPDGTPTAEINVGLGGFNPEHLTVPSVIVSVRRFDARQHVVTRAL